VRERFARAGNEIKRGLVFRKSSQMVIIR